MNKLASAVQTLNNDYQNHEIADDAYSLTMFKKASASIALNEVYPSIATDIVNSFFKKACEGSDYDTLTYTFNFSNGLMKVAGAEMKKESALKLATTAIMNKTASSYENDLACYHIICSMTKEAGIKDRVKDKLLSAIKSLKKNN